MHHFRLGERCTRLRRFAGAFGSFCLKRAGIAAVILTLQGVSGAQILNQGLPVSAGTFRVTVAGTDAKGKETLGSGFFVTATGEALVSRGALLGAVKAELRTDNGKRFRVKSVLADSVCAGLVRAAVSAPATLLPFISLVEIEPPLGQTVTLTAAGSTGAVSAIRNVPGFGPVFRITAPTPVESYGGLVVNSKGQAIGVVLWQGANVTLAGSAETAHYIKSGRPRTLAEWNKSARRPAGIEAEYREGLVRLFQDDYESALETLESVVKKDPGFAEAWFHYGFAQAKLGHQKEKIAAYREAVRLKPDLAAAHYSLGVSYALAGEGKLAVEEFKALEKLDAELADKLEILLEALGHQGHSHGKEETPKVPKPT